MHRFRRTALIGLVIGAATVALVTTIASAAGTKAPLLITPTGLNFGPVVTGSTSATQSVSITNVGSDQVTLAGTGTALTPPFNESDACEGVVLDPGESCDMDFTFSPVGPGSINTSAQGKWNNNAYTIKVVGTGVDPTFTISPTKFDFGNTIVGATSPQQSVTVTNTGPSPAVMAGTGISVAPPFTLTEDCSGATLQPGKSCHMFLRYKPTLVGHDSFDMAGTWNGQAFSINMDGQGVLPTLLVTPTSLNFGTVTMGTDAPDQTVTITNLSTQAVVLDGGADHVGAPFHESDACQGVSLKYGDSCTMSFGFHPTAIGRVTGTATGTWNGTTWKVKLTGIGS
jgi:HYDIN/CFA65/VesB-like, Ig-like domain